MHPPGESNAALVAEPPGGAKRLLRTPRGSFRFGTVPPSFQRKDRIVFARKGTEESSA